MFEGLSAKINDDTILTLGNNNNTADLFFIRILIRFFDKREILFKMSMEDNYNEEDINEFKRDFFYSIYNDTSLSNKEKETLDNIIMMMCCTIKDDFILDLKEIS